MASEAARKPAYYKPYHSIKTPRLLIRSPVSTDAQAIYDLRSSPANNPYSQIEPDISPVEFQHRIEKWTDAAAQGESAFMIVILPAGTETSAGIPSTEDKLIGFGGFNRFFYTSPQHEEHVTSDPTVESKEVLVGDTDLLIDHEYWGCGYAAEALSATIDYGFAVLGCDSMLVETDLVNVPWRSLMNRRLGMEPSESLEVDPADPEGKLEYLVWRFGIKEWAKRGTSSSSVSR